MRVSLIIGVFFLLMGCSIKKVPAVSEYTLEPDPTIAKVDESGCKEENLKILEPFGGSEYATNDLYYVVLPYEQNKYTQSAWYASVSSKIYESLLQSLKKSALFGGVSNYASIAKDGLVLEVQINDFKQYFSEDETESYIVSDITFTLVDAKTFSIISQKQIRKKIPTQSLDAKGGVEALNEALTQTLQEVIAWLRERCR